MSLRKSWFARWFQNAPTSAAKRQSYRPLLEVLEDRTTPTTFIVKSTADSGIGTLRQAMLDANSNHGLDTIIFRFGSTQASQTQPRTFIPLSALPAITDAVIIDGTVPVHGGGAVAHIFEINGRGNAPDGFRLSSNGSIIKGLVINGFSGAGISVSGDDNIIQNNRIGTSFDGNSAKGNQVGIALAGTQANQATGNLIGGAVAGQGNLISGNKEAGVRVTNAFTRFTRIQGNFIGTNAAGTGPLGNVHGVFCDNSPLTTVDLNVISGNSFSGVTVLGFNAVSNAIQSNKIGTAADGVSPLGNLRFGVGVFHGAHQNTIGGNNTIAFSATANILIGSDSTTGGFFSVPAGAGNRVTGNLNFRAPIEIHLGDVNAGPPANDPLDNDSGPNNLQNFPVLTSALPGSTSTSVTISLASSPDTTYQIEIFTFSGVVNGQHADLTFRAVAFVTTDAAGNGSVTRSVPGVFPFVALTATDLTTGDTSLDSGFATNTPPMIQGDVLTPEINEGQKATLSGRLVDPNVDDKLTLRVNWGDGTIKDYHPGLDPFAFQHRYADNGVYNVNFTWFDNHGGSNTRTRQVVVHNVAPELRNLNLSPDNPSVHRRVVLSGRIADPGADTFTLTVAWGDGTVETIERSRDGEFHLKHRYHHAGQFTIHLTVTDDDGGMTDQTLTIDVG